MQLEIMNAHPFTFLIIGFSLLITPMFWHLVLPHSKAIILGWITAITAALMLMINVFQLQKYLGPFGALVIIGMWIIPPVLVWIFREYFKGLNQRTLAGLQIFRVIGGLFILEMARGHIPASFALPAGIGDLIVGCFALFLFLAYKNPPNWGILMLIVLGTLDFLSAFTFGFLSQPSPIQQFAIGFDNQANIFPSGMIPFLLVPYAITFHVLALINWIDQKSGNF